MIYALMHKNTLKSILLVIKYILQVSKKKNIINYLIISIIDKFIFVKISKNIYIFYLFQN